jgi:soluble lytic murein transglycosylase-like protein
MAADSNRMRRGFIVPLRQYIRLNWAAGWGWGVDRWHVWKFILVVILAVPGWAQSLLAQRASVERQMASIRRQRGEVRDVAPVSVAVRPVPVAVARLPCAGIEAPELGRMIELAAVANQVSPDLVREVARQESAFRPCAVSPKGAEGLMQLMPATQASLGVEDPFDPEESLMAGARLLRELLSRYNGSLPLALSAYNAGPKRVDRANGIPPIAETRNYVAQILSRID